MSISNTFKKLVLNTILGVIILLIINIIGSKYNFSIAINEFSALTIGILGIPGLIFLVFLKLMV